MKIVLASRSPQRRAILTQLGIPFRSEVSTHAERTVLGDPVATVEQNARGKAREVAARLHLQPDEIILGVDTIVLLGEEIMGKAAGEAQARRYLLRLAGRTHEVLSGLCLFTAAHEEVGHSVTAVTFRALEDDAVARYVAAGEWRERAGAYAIQGLGAALVQGVRGDYWNVVGLPVPLLADLLQRFGVSTFGWL
jgi:septum formation protein